MRPAQELPSRQVQQGTEAIGNFFREVRLWCAEHEDKSYEKISAFAADLKINAAHLGRIESGKRLPGPEALMGLYKFIVKANMNPNRLLFLWLEAQGLDNYVLELTRKGRKDGG